MDWPETWYLRWKHYKAQSEADYHQDEITHHEERMREFLEDAQFWRNRQIERGKNISYDYKDITCWVNWLLGIFLTLGTVVSITLYYMVTT